jgi:uncharacterized SAM-binding protein YcdF (DUF218 family)
MFFYASKLLWPLAQPSNLLLLLLVVAVLGLLRGRRRFAMPVLCGVTATLVVVGVLPVGEWLLTPLENRFPAVTELPDRVDGVIVLGGAVDLPVTEGRHQIALQEHAERVTTLMELGRRYPDARLVFTGGQDWLAGTTLTEAAAMREFYVRQQFDRARVLFESRARNTYENALFSRQLVDPGPGERWLLVTSAAHMPRAIGVFRAVGWPLTAYPVDYTTTGRYPLWRGFDTSRHLKEFDEAIKAWAGLLAYRASGRTSALLPTP